MNEISSGYGLHVERDPEITCFSTGHDVMRLTVNEGFIMVEDPWLGDFVITDPVSYDLFTTTSFFRSLGVSQLCKSRESSTIPNLASFNRGWGLIAQHELVERFGHMQGLSPERIQAIHIDVEGDDQAHPAFSHQLEQAVQNWGGPEDWHEVIWPRIANLGGFTGVLDRYGIPYDEKIRVPGIEVPEWAKAKDRRDIDVDRLQYIAAEALLWFDHEYVDPQVREKVKKAVDLSNYELTPDGQLAIMDEEAALVLSKLLLLFAAEHYNDPLNRTHLHLGIHAVQHSIMSRRLSWMDEVDKGQTRTPISYFHAIDQDFNDALVTGPGSTDTFIYLISNELNSSGMEERKKFTNYRLAEYARFILDDKAENYPSDYLGPKRVEFGPKSSTVHTEVVELTDEERAVLDQVKIPRLDNSDALSYLVGPLKNRYIDPLVRRGDGYVRLSEIPNSPYPKLLAEQQYLQSLGVRVTFAFPKDYGAEFRQGMMQNDKDFSDLIDREQMTNDQFRAMLEHGARRARQIHVGAGSLIVKRELDS
ncbi:MAG TPA: hypothetical protein VMR34_04735 [Candidatus Saccharimonadales bacterium]|nr:hypothetical protein [Candidatus Saccharimonadales bacterium]